MKALVMTGKRQRAASVTPSPPPPVHDKDRPIAASGLKKQRLESSTAPDEKQSEDLINTSRGKRKRAKETKRAIETSTDEYERKRRRVEEKDARTASPAVSSVASEGENAIELSTSEEKRAAVEEKKEEAEEEEEEEEEKARFPPSPLVIPSLRREEEGEGEEEEKENRQDATSAAHLDEFIGSSQGSDTDLVAAWAPLQELQKSDVDRVRQRTLLRSVQVTPPPSARMLDRKNPPPPPKRPKRRNHGGLIIYARTYPRLALSPLVDDSPPTSPRVFRSLENEFAFAMQDTPEIRPRVRPAPRMARGSRRSTRAGSLRARRSLDTPTSTMVLRSRQLNPSLSVDGGKPENQREREQRDAQRRQ